jgi:hypothetical protein
MKKTLLYTLLFLAQFNASSQNTQPLTQIYDHYEDEISTKLLITSPAINQCHAYGEAMSYILESNIVMFAATEDLKYLESFIENSHIMQSKRDDQILPN